MDSKLKSLLDNVYSVFTRCGYKSATMDDIARELGMSKKTIYTMVEDKKDLVIKVVENELEKDKAASEEIFNQDTNAIDQLFEMSKFTNKRLKNMHPSMQFDLAKYYPQSWNIFKRYKVDFILGKVTNNMRQGIEEGLYRDNLDIPIIARLFVSKVELCFDPQIFPQDQYKFADIHREMMRYHVRGIASEKGMKYLKEKMKKEFEF